MNILEQIAERTRERVRLAKLKTPLDDLIRQIQDLKLRNDLNNNFRDNFIKDNLKKEIFRFENVLKSSENIFICECKKASPSKGVISENFNYIEIAKDYEDAGAAAISVLTEPEYFMGDNKYLCEIAQCVKIPCLRKDFIIDEYMIYEAKILGASAVLLIVSLLDENILKKYIKICDSLNLSALVEAHDENEIKTALNAGARIIGVNNRNLKDFKVDVSNSERLRKLVPEDIIFVAESGIKTHEDIKRLNNAGINVFLIGETLMKAHDKRAMLDALMGLN